MPSGANSVVGISVGCLLGMLPLLFMDQDEKTAERIFADLDVDKNGLVTHDELQGAFSDFGFKFFPEVLEEHIRDDFKVL